MDTAYIKDAVANLWRHPILAPKEEWVDRNLETQLLFGDVIRILDTQEDFAYVEALCQDVFQGGWSNYRGFVEKRAIKIGAFEVQNMVVKEFDVKIQELDLSFGTAIDFMPCDNFKKKEAVLLAKKFLGSKYLWGGCSSPINSSNPLRGVDCSGLVYLIYKVLGKRLPRNAHDQYLMTKRILFSELQEGDLLFSSENGLKGRIDHVMIVSENQTLIESVMSAGVVRQITIKEKFGMMPDGNLSSQIVRNIAIHPSQISNNID